MRSKTEIQARITELQDKMKALDAEFGEHAASTLYNTRRGILEMRLEELLWCVCDGDILPDANLFAQGYRKALQDINIDEKVIIEKWEPSVCPRCFRNFSDFEPCDDGYYSRAESLTRCPYCGQAIKWRD